MSTREYVLLLGSNIGDKKRNIETALSHLKTSGVDVLHTTDFLITEPVGFASANNFCNFAANVKTEFSPVRLLALIKNIERQMGRLEDSAETGGYTDRIIDIDIVQSGNLRFVCPKLFLPHYRHLHEREFSQKLLTSLALKAKTEI